MSDEDRNELLKNEAFAAKSQLLAVGLAYMPSIDRIDLLPPTRDFARRYREPGVTSELNWRKHYLGLIAGMGGQVGKHGGAEAVARLSPEIPNIDAALCYSVAVRDLNGTLVPIIANYRELLRFTGLGSTTTLAIINDYWKSEQVPQGQAECAFSIGLIAHHRWNHKAARNSLDEAQKLYQQIGSVMGQANCIRTLGHISLLASDFDAAHEAYEKALPLYKQISDALGEAYCIKSLGDIALQRSDLGAAREAYEAALPIFKRIDDVLGEANCLQSLGEIAFKSRDYQMGRKYNEQALPLYRRVGDRLGEANCFQAFGRIAQREGHYEEAIKAFTQALHLYERIQDPYNIGWANFGLAMVTQGDEGAAHVTAARIAWESIGRGDLVALVEPTRQAEIQLSKTDKQS